MNGKYATASAHGAPALIWLVARVSLIYTVFHWIYDTCHLHESSWIQLVSIWILSLSIPRLWSASQPPDHRSSTNHRTAIQAAVWWKFCLSVRTLQLFVPKQKKIVVPSARSSRWYKFVQTRCDAKTANIAPMHPKHWRKVCHPPDEPGEEPSSLLSSTAFIFSFFRNK